jgi:hypoxanthine phosphoribosyltransferase
MFTAENGPEPRVLISQEEIARRVGELGAEITAAYQGRNPLFVGVLRGAAVFLADLVRQVDVPLRVDFISVSSYGSGTRTSGRVRLIKDLETSAQDLDLVLVEDIVDTGLTISYLARTLHSRRPASLAVCTLLSKPARRRVEVPADYIGFEVPDEFLIGYGLDYNQRYRNLPYIGVLGKTPGEN